MRYTIDSDTRVSAIGENCMPGRRLVVDNYFGSSSGIRALGEILLACRDISWTAFLQGLVTQKHRAIRIDSAIVDAVYDSQREGTCQCIPNLHGGTRSRNRVCQTLLPELVRCRRASRRQYRQCHHYSSHCSPSRSPRQEPRGRSSCWG